MVLRMPQIEYIKDLYENEGKSLRSISRITGMDFRTVQKYAYRDDWNPPVKPKMNPDEYPVLGQYIPTINEWLEKDELEPRKQRHTITKVYNRLQKEQGFKGSYTTVKRYVNRKREQTRKRKEGFLPLEQPPGHAQIDFGESKSYDATGMEQKIFALTVSFPHSNSGWTQVFPSENQECLLTGLQRIFGHIGGVPASIRLDNMSTAVAQILKGGERIITDGFYRFMLHHRFRSDFCSPDKGNEKGHVENKVGYTRRNMLVPVPVITDYDSFNEDLLRRCDEDHDREHHKHGALIRELWEEDRKHLLTLPEHEYEVFSYESLKVSKTGYIHVDKSKYGLSPEMFDKIVQAKVFFDKIEVYYDRSQIKTFRRSYVKNSEDHDWKDYLSTLVKKPRATEHTRFFNQMPRLWQEYLKGVHGRERKTALLLLSEIVHDGNESLCDSVIEIASGYGALNNDNIRQCYFFISKPDTGVPPLELKITQPPLNYHPDLSAYNRLTGGVPR